MANDSNFHTEPVTYDTDVLIIGGGTAGCYAAITLGRCSHVRVLIAEKAGIRRSGCLAAGVNAINAYISSGHVPHDYTEYAMRDAEGIAREDLLDSMAERFNAVTADLEKMGLTILKDESGAYVTRGWRNLKINGENIKPILASAVRQQHNVQVVEHLNITDLLVDRESPRTREQSEEDGADARRWTGQDGQGQSVESRTCDERTDQASQNTEGRPGAGRVCGAVGYFVQKEPFTACVIRASAVLMATGGAAGLYRPNNPGLSKHRMWYPPFNTGAGYAMGLKAGAEMTTLEMRFIALRCKDTIAPTGTIAQGAHAKQINGLGEVYETRYGLTTSQRVYGTVMENREGRGPCYLATKGIDPTEEEQLYKAYLNMAPTQTLRWLERGKGPAQEDVEIAGTEPYIVGGHTASGYWIGTDRGTTVPGLYAAGDVAGLAPQKYVTGALAEGEIAAESIMDYLREKENDQTQSQPSEQAAPGEPDSSEEGIRAQVKEILGEYQHFLENEDPLFTAWQIEEAMQKIMDEYAGGISTDYRYNERSLEIAGGKIGSLEQLIQTLGARNAREMLDISEVKERLLVCRALIEHLKARRETRWHCFAENTDYPEKDPAFEVFINSKLEADQVKVIFRDIHDGHVLEETG